MNDFPKLKCPFIRKEFDVNINDWKNHGNRYMLRKPRAYLVIDKINPGYEWCFNDKHTFVTEKLDGTNCCIKTENGRLIKLQNRKNVIDPLQIKKGKTFIIEGIFTSIQKGYIKDNSIQYGEVIGNKLQGNPYHLLGHEFIPFERCINYYKYKSFHKYDRTFDNWSFWFKDYLFSLFYRNKAIKLKELNNNIPDNIFAEGIIFYNLKRKEQGKVYMAKLRRNMFKWFYEPDIEIYDYDKNINN